MALSKVGGNQIDTVSGDLTVDTNTLKVDATNNRVGAGTASPSHLIHAVGSDSTNMIVAENATGVKTAISHGTNDGRIGNVTNHGLIFTVNNAEKARITTAGQFRLQSAGITFNNDTAAANELDDYEEGTWTPSIGGNATYDVQSGAYTKIGRMVFVWLYVAVNTKGTGSGNTISGLPFNPGTSNQHAGVAYYNGILQNTYEFHLNFRADGTIRSELKTSFGTGQSSGGSWTKDGATCIASGWYYT